MLALIVCGLALMTATNCGTDPEASYEAAAGSPREGEGLEFSVGDCVDPQSPTGVVVSMLPITCAEQYDDGNGMVIVLAIDDPESCQARRDVYASFEQDGHDYCVGFLMYNRDVYARTHGGSRSPNDMPTTTFEVLDDSSEGPTAERCEDAVEVASPPDPARGWIQVAPSGVDCTEALEVVGRYFNDEDLERSGSSGAAGVGDWTCQSMSGAGTEMTGRVGTCERGADYIEMFVAAE